MTTLSPTALVDEHNWGDVVTSSGGIELILAGPGTGKTEFLVQRAIHLLSEGGIYPSELLLLTFSRRAASDLKDRVLRGLGGSVADVTATTFHAYASGLLDRHGDHLTEGISYRPMTGPEQQATVTDLLAQEDPGDWPVNLRPILTSPTLAAEATDFLTRCRERLLEPADISELARVRTEWRALPNFMRRYDDHLERHDLVDYGMLIRRAIDLIERRPQLVVDMEAVLVDEYQDTSPAQALLLQRVVGTDTDLVVTADPAQAIYAFRGADPSNVAVFPQRFEREGSPVLVRNLSRSYRVPPPILEGARRVLGDEIPAAPVEPATHEGRLSVHVFDQESAEADWIATQLERHHRLERVPYSKMAVLTRSSRGFGTGLAWALDRHGIPHDGEDTRLLEHGAVRIIADVVTVTTLLSEPLTPGAKAEIDRLLTRIVLGPVVGATVGQERELARNRRLVDDYQGPLTGDALLDEIIRTPRWATELPAAHGFWWLWERLPGLETLIGHPGYDDHRQGWAALSYALNRALERDSNVTLSDVLTRSSSEDFEASARLTHQRPTKDAVTTTTLHQAKGLEFDHVFIANALEGVFPDPSGRSRPLLRPELLDDDPGGDLRRRRLDEERRLAYTGTTRARRSVVWTATIAGIEEADRRPSRFLFEVAGVDDVDELRSPYRNRPTVFAPISRREAGIELRRRLLDPAMVPTDRLAALSVLTEGWNATELSGVPEPGPDDGIIGDDPILSPSQAESYLDCPRRYVLERRLGVRGGDLRHLRFGLLVHQVMEMVERGAMTQGRPHATLDEAVAVAQDVFGTSADFGTPALNRAWLRSAIDFLTGLYTEWPGSETDPPFALEHDVSLEVGGVTWRGRIDRIERRDSQIVVIDYKTSKNVHVAETEGSLQLGFYVLALESDPDFSSPVSAEIWAPRWRAGRPVVYDRHHLPETTELLSEAVTGILTEDWTPRPSSSCQRCGVRDSCPVWPEGMPRTL